MKKIIIGAVALILLIGGYKGVGYYQVYKFYDELPNFDFKHLDDEIMYFEPEFQTLETDLAPDETYTVEQNGLVVNIPKQLEDVTSSDNSSYYVLEASPFDGTKKIVVADFWFGDEYSFSKTFDPFFELTGDSYNNPYDLIETSILTTPDQISFFDLNQEMVKEYALLGLKYIFASASDYGFYFYDTDLVKGYVFKATEDSVGSEFFTENGEGYLIAGVGLTEDELVWAILNLELAE